MSNEVDLMIKKIFREIERELDDIYYKIDEEAYLAVSANLAVVVEVSNRNGTPRFVAYRDKAQLLLDRLRAKRSASNN